MKRILQILALVVLVATAGTWLATGANRGWTKTKIPVKTVDEVTGIEGTTSWQTKFLPGVDFLGAGGLVAVALGGASIFFRNQPKTK